MGEPSTDRSRSYGTTRLSGHAAALQGDNYGNILNVQQANFYYNSIPQVSVPHLRKIVRHNRVFLDHTIETITAFQDGGPLHSRGRSSTVTIRWDRGEDLGAGLFGEVHREDHWFENQIVQTRAVKVLRRRQLQRLKIDYKKEIGVLAVLSQPEYNHMFVEFYSWYEHLDSVYMAMEFVPCGDLEKFLGSLKEEDVREISDQVLNAISVMHRLDIVHRDIKPANIFVIVSTPSWHVKIGDFGICKSTTTQRTSLHTQVGTTGYQAPEVLGLVAGGKAGQYDAKCDIWSFGCLVHQMLSGKVPFDDLHSLLSYCATHGKSFDSKIDMLNTSWPGKMLVRTCLLPLPQERPNAEEALDILAEWMPVSSRFQADSAAPVLPDGEHVAMYSIRNSQPNGSKAAAELAKATIDEDDKFEHIIAGVGGAQAPKEAEEEAEFERMIAGRGREQVEKETEEDDEIERMVAEMEQYLAEKEAEEARHEEVYMMKKAAEKEAQQQKEKEEAEDYEANLKKLERQAEEHELAREKRRAGGSTLDDEAKKMFAALKRSEMFPALKSSAAQEDEFEPMVAKGSTSDGEAQKMYMTLEGSVSESFMSLMAAYKLRDPSCVKYPKGVMPPKPEVYSNGTSVGRLRYNRDFLLQFMNVFREKPVLTWDERLRKVFGT